MKLIVAHFQWIMVASGVLTCSMVYAAIAPQAALLSTFGETTDVPAANLVIRNWGALITLVGVSLIYGAFEPSVRRPVLILAGASKIIFIGLVLSEGAHFLGHQAGIATAIDAIWVALFAWYLIATRQG